MRNDVKLTFTSLVFWNTITITWICSSHRVPLTPFGVTCICKYKVGVVLWRTPRDNAIWRPFSHPKAHSWSTLSNTTSFPSLSFPNSTLNTSSKRHYSFIKYILDGNISQRNFKPEIRFWQMFPCGWTSQINMKKNSTFEIQTIKQCQHWYTAVHVGWQNKVSTKWLTWACMEN